MIKKLIFATSHKGKVGEAQGILDIPLEIADIEVDEVQSMDLEYVARKKVEEVFKIVQQPVIIDDVGLKIRAWNDFPGPLVKFLQRIVGNKKVVELLKDEQNREVIVQSAIGFHDGTKSHVFIGEVKGIIATEERGTEGYGFDPIIIPDGQDKTYAEMGLEGKNKLSHRRKAFDKLKEHLDSQGK
ncbi:MAG: non-canonical purine NTP pyrophosphatase, RdgB/HAM1 family [Candidatus Levybacteria bacterium RIFCSPHIGHO2_01_FULL_37_17]|nr:MAG: non-canonical purine NTP pyrophosphatase, RdgB/HAM1 family [Candidatus Levybacteria bacterium RIFCSPHIGHO2_01_FULL_37_17]OGH37119.1 MAG: non-canonical purine NTP pyrophosphatase, RdgB/HAM1 family [Candidatus Levybacteria bacterium RIFCSPLOWO2_01_FULL_38_23]